MVEHTAPATTLTTVSGRAVCPWSHTVKVGGQWRRGDAPETPVRVTQSNGVQQVKLRCTSCGTTSSALPATVAARWQIDTPAEERDHVGDVECAVTGCTSRHVEYHHFAPRNVFTTEADNWPVMPLCRAHHHEWHHRMDGYRWHRKAVA